MVGSPSSECMTCPDSKSHSFAVWSQEAVTNCCPSTNQSQLITGAAERVGEQHSNMHIKLYTKDSCGIPVAACMSYHIQDFMIMHLPLCARSTMMGVFITDISTVSV